MAGTRESTIENYLLSQCRAHGILCLKFVSPTRAGVPDRIVVAPRSTVFVEVKCPGGRLRKLQQRTHAKLRRHGAEVHVVDDKPSVDVLIAVLLESPSDQRITAP
ncbi:VRR-NUC domain-containing protein [Streptomyces sp. NPDC057302]|uniref:VRR-NUC domain-containing protein n=1 Tax=Streptomyces sp. NPDC057302 TaxID=3346094 RepID=UPI003640DB04